MSQYSYPHGPDCTCGCNDTIEEDRTNSATFAEAHFSAHEKRVEDALAAQRAAWPKDPLLNEEAMAMLVADLLLFCDDKKIAQGDMLEAGRDEYVRRMRRGITL